MLSLLPAVFLAQPCCSPERGYVYIYIFRNVASGRGRYTRKPTHMLVVFVFLSYIGPIAQSRGQSIPGVSTVRTNRYPYESPRTDQPWTNMC